MQKPLNQQAVTLRGAMRVVQLCLPWRTEGLYFVTLMRMIDGYGEATVELAILSSSEHADVRSVDLGVRGFYGINILAEC